MSRYKIPKGWSEQGLSAYHPRMSNLYKKRGALARFFRVSHHRTVVFEPAAYRLTGKDAMMQTVP